jgi:histidinol-phosphate aminotransferase
MNTTPRLNPFVDKLRAYAPCSHDAPVELKLSGNEGAAPAASIWRALAPAEQDVARRYPSQTSLAAQLARRIGVDPERLVVTAGGDDAIDRICRMTLGPKRQLILPTPTFEMIERYATLCGASVCEVDWAEGAYPTEAVLQAIGPQTALIAMVSPNNPTGAIATAGDLKRVAAAAPDAVIMVDQAYAEFSGDELTNAALQLPNAIVVRTLSKAWGLAGLRVGYAIAPVGLAKTLRAIGQPYAVAAPSLALASAAIERPETMLDYLEQVATERDALARLCDELALDSLPSQANFVLTRPPDPGWLRDGLAGLGIGIRVWPGDPKLGGAARITCPGDAADFARLERALRTVVQPQAMLFDMDGVLLDVSRSYRAAIAQTAASFGVALGEQEIADAKEAGDANDDWALTYKLVRARGIDVSLSQVTQRFESLYQGADGSSGLRERESLLIDRPSLVALRERVPLAVVTGRPRADAEAGLARFEIRDLFDVVVCREDAPLKPDPAPLRLALEKLGAERAWMIGDSVDDVRAARAAGVLALGFQAEADDSGARVLRRAGAGRVLRDLSALGGLLS